MSFGAGDFVLPVDKPEGPTSHDVVSAARKALGERRVGHTGTLDPFASGLLLLCVGRTTRLAEYLSGMDKSYEATARLGVTTDTLDREGTVCASSDDWRSLDAARIRTGLQEFVGEIAQVPPQFSAKKVEGEAMHRRARRGERIELPPVTVTVHEARVEAIDGADVRFTIRCSSGTYIRCIARDLGEVLGVGAHLTELRRTTVGSFDVRDAIGLNALGDAASVRRAAISPIESVRHLSSIEVDRSEAERLLHGQRVRLSSAVATSPVHIHGDALDESAPVAVSHGGSLVAIGELDDGVLRPRKVFAS